MSRKRLALLALATAARGALAGAPTGPASQSGNDFVAQSAACRAAYAVGVLDTFNTLARAINATLPDDPANSNRLCTPAGLTAQQLLGVVDKYFAAHPEDRRYPASGTVIVAIQDAWPCPETKP